MAQKTHLHFLHSGKEKIKMKTTYQKPEILVIGIENEGIIAQSIQYKSVRADGIVGYGGQIAPEADEVADTYRTMIWAK